MISYRFAVCCLIFLGLGQMLEAQKGPKRQGCTQGNCENGAGLFYYDNGDKFAGEFQNSQPNGRGNYYFKNGDLYQGTFKNGRRHGYGTFTWANGDVYVGEYQNDQREGEGAYYYANKKLPDQVGTWKAGKLVEAKKQEKPAELSDEVAGQDKGSGKDPFGQTKGSEEKNYNGKKFKALAGMVPNQKRQALVVGNGQYTENRLRNAENDALAIAQELQRSGFEVTIYTNANQRDLKKAIRTFGQELKEHGGVGLFYYAGHGLQAEGRNYLVPVAADIRKEQDIEFECVDLGRILVEMEYAQNALNIVILDACRDNPYRDAFRNGTGRNSHNGLAAIGSAPYNSFIAFSTAPGAVAQDGSGENGLYTEQLLLSLRQKGLKLEDVFKQVRSQVRRASNGQQIPWELSSVEDDFFFKK